MQGLSGTLGVVLTVPITAAVAAVLIGKKTIVKEPLMQDIYDGSDDYEEPEKFVPVKQPEPGKKWQMGASYAEDKELQAIFEKQFGPVKRRLANESGFGYTDNQGSGKRTQKEYVYKENKNK